MMFFGIDFRRTIKTLGFWLVGLSMVPLIGCAPASPMGAPSYSRHNVLAFSPDGQYLADGIKIQNRVDLYKVHIGDAPRLERVRKIRGHGAINTVRSVAWSSDGTQLASAGLDDVVIIWDPLTGEEKRRFPDLNGLEELIFLPEGSSLAMAGPDSLVRIWDIENNTLIAELRGHTAPVLAIDVSKNGDLLATAGIDQTIRLWRTQDWSLVRVLEGHEDPVLSVDFSPDGTLLLTSSNGTDIRLWSIGDKKEETVIHVTDLAVENAKMEQINQVGGFLVLASAAAGTYTGAARTPHGKRMTAFNCPAKFSPDGKQIAYILQSELFSHGSHHIEVVDAETFKLINRFNGYIGSLDYHPSSSYLASSGVIQLDLIEPSTGKKY